MLSTYITRSAVLRSVYTYTEVLLSSKTKFCILTERHIYIYIVWMMESRLYPQISLDPEMLANLDAQDVGEAACTYICICRLHTSAGLPPRRIYRQTTRESARAKAIIYTGERQYNQLLSRSGWILLTAD